MDDRDNVPVADTERLIVPVALTVLDRVIDGEAVPEELTERVLDGEAVADHVKEAFAELDGEPVPDLEIVGEADVDLDIVPVGE